MADEIDRALAEYRAAPEGPSRRRKLDRLLGLLRPEMIKAVRARGLVAEDDVEDVVQEALIVLYRHGLAQFRGDGPFLNYAMHIAGRGSWARDNTNGLLPDENMILVDDPKALERDADHRAPGPDAWAEGKDLGHRVERALVELARRSPDQARAVRMASKGATPARIAHVLGVSLGNARLLLHRGRDEVRKMLAQDEAGEREAA